MWMLDNQTPYQAERTWVRDKDGVHHWIVVVKATFDIGSDGILKLSQTPVLPLYAPEYHGEPGKSSVRYDADLVAMKPQTDVYLNAVAYSPRGRPRKKVKVSFILNGKPKELVVYGERIWHRSLFGRIVPSSPQPFESMPITYERALGGFDQAHPDPKHQRIDLRNPLGSGAVGKRTALIGKPAPSIEYAGFSLGKRWPAGFGAVDSFWNPRNEFIGTYDEKWMASRKPLLPEDYDSRCLLASPLDQQARGYLQGGEKVELLNLTPSGHLQFTLPSEFQEFETYFGTTRKDHKSELVSVIIDSEGPRLILVWQTSLRCGPDGEYLDRTVIRRKVRA